jgi:hypothetical protein
MPPNTDCSAITSCGGVRSNSAGAFLDLPVLFGNSAILIIKASHLPLTPMQNYLNSMLIRRIYFPVAKDNLYQ